MSTRREVYQSIRQIPREEHLAGGTGLCGGCGGLLSLRLLHKALGPNVVFVNAAGCLTLLAVFPTSPLRSSWLYTAMGSAPAGAQGVRDALDVLRAKGRLREEDDLKVVVVTGDGAGSTTLGYFGPSDDQTNPSAMPEGGFGRLNIRYNPYQALPDGINIAVEILPDTST